jgi:hypothetical protein
MTPIVNRHVTTLRRTLTPAPAGGRSDGALPGVFDRGRDLARQGVDSLRAIRFDHLPQVGRTSGLGLALLVGSAALWLSTVQPLARDAALLETQIAGLDTAAREGIDGVGARASELDLLLERLPTQAELPGIVALVVAQADEAGLELGRGEYELTSTRSGQLARYHLSLPVRGSYPQVRQFIDGSLAAVPALGLEHLRLERASVGDRIIDADLRFSVVVKGGA